MPEEITIRTSENIANRKSIKRDPFAYRTRLALAAIRHGSAFTTISARAKLQLANIFVIVASKSDAQRLSNCLHQKNIAYAETLYRNAVNRHNLVANLNSSFRSGRTI